MTRRKRDCAAPATSCGTASGWRYGGRCTRCRLAHNEETGRYRGMDPVQRQQVLHALRAGDSAETAAAAVGRSAQSLISASVTDGELRLALEGAPRKAQTVARIGDFLAALTRAGGDIGLANRLAGTDEGEHLAWRKQVPGYAAAENAVLTIARAPYRRTQHFISDEQLEEAAQLLEGGVSVAKAAQAVHVSEPGLRKAASRSERLRKALPAVKPQSRKGTPSRLTPERERLMRELWPDPEVPARVIAAWLGVSAPTLRVWAARLGLPRRKRFGGLLEEAREAPT